MFIIGGSNNQTSPRGQNVKTLLIIPLLLGAALCVSCRAPVSELLDSVETTAELDYRQLNYRVWLPDGYDKSDEDYPLLVWFHGGGENHNGWGREGRIGEIVHMRTLGGALKPFIVVSPSAGSFTPIYRAYERVLIGRVLPDVRARYRTTDKVVAFGHSMGGLSALTVAMRNPDLFDAVAVASPFVFDSRPWDLPEEKRAYDDTYGSKFLSQWRYELREEFDGPGDFAPWDPFSLARENAGRIEFPLLLTSGDEDPLGLFPHNRLLHERLTKYGIRHEWFVQEGIGHGTVEDPYIMKWLNDNAH